MSKKTVSMDGMVNEGSTATAPVSGARKRLSLHLGEADYRALRMMAVETGLTHQKIIEKALQNHLADR